MKIHKLSFLILLLIGFIFGQDIINDIGSSGEFIVRNPTDTLFTIDGSTGNVGIGKINPNASLEVAGRITGGFGAKFTAGTKDWNHISNSQSGSGYTLMRGLDSQNSPNPGDYHYFHPFNFEYTSKDGTGNITQLAIPYGYNSTIDKSIYIRGRYDNTWSPWARLLIENTQGNVGIGTTSPNAKLEVVGQVKITGGSPGANKVLTSDANGLATWETPNSAGSLWTESSNNIYRNSGNVGIGTNNPIKPFDLKGEARFITTGENDGQFEFSYIDGDEAYFRMFNGNNYGLIAQSDHNSPKIGSWNSGSLHIHPYSYATQIDTVKGALTSFDFDDMRVGIGTTTPSQKLTVVGTIESTTGGFKFPDGTIQTTATTGGGSGDNWGSQVVVSDATLSGDGTSGSPLSVVSAGSADGDAWGVAGEDQTSSIGRTGNVGIGTNSPTTKLEVAGQVKITGGSPGDGKVLTSDANGLATWETPGSSGNSLWSESGNNIYRNTGYVGIGTASPSEELDVNGTIKATHFGTTLNNLGSIYGSSIIDWDFADGNIAYILIVNSGQQEYDLTVNVQNPSKIGSYILIVEQVYGGNSITFSSGIQKRSIENSPPVLTPYASGTSYPIDVFTIVSTGSKLLFTSTNNMITF